MAKASKIPAFSGSFTAGPVKTSNTGRGFFYFNDGPLFVWLLGKIFPDPETENDNPASYIANEYKTQGKKLFLNLDGDYTVVIKENSDLLIFLDFKGAGPLIFYNKEFFANNLLAVSEKNSADNKPDLKALAFFLKYGFTPSEKSGIMNIKRLPPGCLLTIKNEKVEVENLYPEFCAAKVEAPEHESSLMDIYSSLHKGSIKRRIKDKTAISLLLSGGYDSGANLAGLREIYDGKLTAFTVSFKNNPFSELEFVEIMADHFNAELNNYVIDGSEINFLPDIVRQTGIPFQESGLMINYSVMKEVQKFNPDIVLGGDGNDQFFGTGGMEIGFKYLVSITGIALLLRLFRFLTRGIKSVTLFNKINFYIEKVLNVLKADRWGFETSDLKIKPDEKKYFQVKAAWSLEKLFNYRRQQVDINYTISEVILFKASRMAELFEVNLSFPYLTPGIFSFLNSIPRQMRIKGNLKELIRGRGKGKYLHKALYSKKLPEIITSRKKQGGFVPLSVFFKDEERNGKFFRMLRESDLLALLLKNRTKTISGLEAFLKQQNPWFWEQQFRLSQLLNLIVIAVWENIYIRRSIL